LTMQLVLDLVWHLVLSLLDQKLSGTWERNHIMLVGVVSSPSFLQLWIRNIFWFWNIIKTGTGNYCQSQMPVQTGLDWMSFQQFIAHCAQSAKDSDPQLWWHIDSKLFLNGVAQQCPWCLLSNADCQHFDNPDTLAQFEA
jgi:hypothetical protein